MRKFILSAIGAVTGLGAVAAAVAAVQPAEMWEIGPIIRSRNYSVGMPLNPEPADRGWHFDFPYPNEAAGHVHYVTFNPGPLLGKSRIVVRYRVDAARGAGFVPREAPGAPATISLFLQRRGDNWSAKRQYEHFRWYAPQREIRPGVHEMVVSLDDPEWISVMGKPVSVNPEAFRDALAQTHRLGIVFGSAGGRGHGVYATGPARFTLIDFRII